MVKIKPGALLVQGATEEYYYVQDAAGTQLASQRLNQPLSLLEGTYTWKLNNVTAPVAVEAGRVIEFQAGSLTVKGRGEEYPGDVAGLESLGRAPAQLAAARLLDGQLHVRGAVGSNWILQRCSTAAGR